MIAPIGNLANKLFSFSNFSSSTTANSQASLIPTVFPNNMGMDFPTGPIPDNYDEMRGRNLSTNKSISRNTSMSSTKLSVVYHEKMVSNNLKDDDEPMDSVSALSYETEQERAFHINKAAKQQEHVRQLWCMTQKMMILSTFNYNTTHKPQLSQISGVVLFTQFHYMVQSNKSLPMLRTSKIPWILWQGILLTNR